MGNVGKAGDQQKLEKGGMGTVNRGRKDENIGCIRAECTTSEQRNGRQEKLQIKYNYQKMEKDKMGKQGK